MKKFFEMDKYVETDVEGFIEVEAEADTEETFRPNGEEVPNEQAE